MVQVVFFHLNNRQGRILITSLILKMLNCTITEAELTGLLLPFIPQDSIQYLWVSSVRSSWEWTWHQRPKWTLRGPKADPVSLGTRFQQLHSYRKWIIMLLSAVPRSPSYLSTPARRSGSEEKAICPSYQPVAGPERGRPGGDARWSRH